MSEEKKEGARPIEEIQNWNAVISGLERLEKIWSKQRSLIINRNIEQLPLKAQQHLVHEFNLFSFEEAIPMLLGYVYASGGNFKEFLI